MGAKVHINEKPTYDQLNSSHALLRCVAREPEFDTILIVIFGLKFKEMIYFKTIKLENHKPRD